MSTPRGLISFAPETRVVVRDAAWLVRRVDMSFDDGQQLTCDGISELVRSHEGDSLATLDRAMRGLGPKKDKLVHGDL